MFEYEDQEKARESFIKQEQDAINLYKQDIKEREARIKECEDGIEKAGGAGYTVVYNRGACVPEGFSPYGKLIKNK